MPSSCAARARTPGEIVTLLWERGEPTLYTPTGPEDRELVLDLLEAGGNAVVLVDEAWAWIDSHAAKDDPLLALMRTHRHRNLAFVLTTQHLSGDIPQAAFSCAPRVCVFRCTAQAALDRIERDFGIPADEVRSLPQFHYLERTLGFS